jgi:hypothetical protein
MVLEHFAKPATPRPKAAAVTARSPLDATCQQQQIPRCRSPPSLIREAFQPALIVDRTGGQQSADLAKWCLNMLDETQVVYSSTLSGSASVTRTKTFTPIDLFI